jgi:N-acetyl-anhydromuramyl-L-alanine amidase AmpD
MVIDKKTYKLSDNNYHKQEYTKKQIVIGHTSRKEMYHYGSWINRHNGKYKRTAAYTIDKNGKIYEHYDPKYYSEYVTLHDMGPFTIPITLSNIGWVQKDSVNDRYYDWLGHNYILEDSDIVTKRWRNKEHWVKYSEEQINSLKNLTDKLCDEFEIKNNCIGHTVFNEDVDIYEGITFKSNYYQEATDISPAFDMELFKTTV